MRRSSLLSCSFRSLAGLILATSAVAQQELRPRPLLAQPRDAGVYHVATGTWSHATGGSAQLGPDVIYNASKPSGYFGTGWEGQEGVDEGILPGTSNPNFNGPADTYSINGFQFAYCTLGSSVDWTFTFYDSYVPCDLPSSGACIQSAGTVLLPGAPGNGCWLVTLDLAGGGEFCMDADGGPCAPGYQGAATDLDHFGWGATSLTTGSTTTGPILAGADPTWAPEGEGTCYLPGLTCPQGPTANGARDLFAIDPVGCFWFGGYSNPNGCAGPALGVFAQFHLLLYTDCNATSDCSPYSTYCDTHPAQLGDLSISTHQVAGSPVLLTSNLTGGLFAYHLIGDGNGVILDPPGSLGELCLGGSTPGIGRYVLDAGAVVADAFSTNLIGGTTGGGSGNLPNPPGGTLMPGQTWNFQTWTRIAGSSRWSTAITVSFQ